MMQDDQSLIKIKIKFKLSIARETCILPWLLADQLLRVLRVPFFLFLKSIFHLFFCCFVFDFIQYF